MTQATLNNPHVLIEALARRNSEPSWLSDLRRQALAAYFDGPSPDRVQHLWRYTDPAPFFLPHAAPLTPAAAPGSTLHPTVRNLLERGEVSGAACFLGGGKPHVVLSPELQASGVKVLSFHDALNTIPDLVRSHLGKLVGGDVSPEGSGKFEALNLAAFAGGTVIHVPRNVQIAKPIHVWLSAPAGGAASFLATRILVIAEERAEVTVIDECEGGDDELKLNAVIEVFAAQASRVRHVSVQRLHKGVAYHVVQRVSVARDASLLTAMASLGGGVTKSDFGSFLDGPGASVELFGFLFGEGKQHFDHHTLHDHRSGKSYSNLDFKVVLKDRARSAYTGLIRIEPGCPDSEAYQENRNLLLNDGARAESIPELEILTDEVKCTHGATVGTLDAQHVFYLMSRGIDRAEAIRLIVGGFIEPTLSRLDADLRERLRSHVEDRVKDL